MEETKHAKGACRTLFLLTFHILLILIQSYKCMLAPHINKISAYPAAPECPLLPLCFHRMIDWSSEQVTMASVEAVLLLLLLPSSSFEEVSLGGGPKATPHTWQETEK